MSSFRGLALALLILGLPLTAQVRITVDRDGLHFVPFSELEGLIELNRQTIRHLGLFDGARRIPLLLRGRASQSHGPNDGIVFFARRGTSRSTQRRSYVLKLTRDPRRIQRPPRDRGVEGVGEARIRVVARERKLFDPGGSSAGLEPGDPWFWRALPAPVGDPRADEESLQTFALELATEPVRGTHALLRIRVRGPQIAGVTQRVRVNLNGNAVGADSWDTPGDHTIELKVPASQVFPYNTVQLQNASDVAVVEDPADPGDEPLRNTLLVREVEMEVEALLMGPGDPGQQLLYRILPDTRRREEAYEFRTLSTRGQQVFYPRRGVLSRSSLLVPLEDEQEVLACVAGIAANEMPVEIAKLSPTDVHLPGEGGDYLVITLPRFRKRLIPLLRHREEQGFTPVVVETREIYDTFGGGNFSPEAIQRFVSACWRNWKKKPTHLVLVGDADFEADWLSRKETLPAAQTVTAFNGYTASDALYGDVDGDRIPEMAVGRLCVRSDDELYELVERTIRAEKKVLPGDWKRTLRWIVGNRPPSAPLDGWNGLGQGLAAETDERFETRVAQVASNGPFSHPARGFHREIVRHFNLGGLLFTYFGNGDADAFAPTPARPKALEVFGTRRVGELNAAGRGPVTLLLSPNAGFFDRPDPDCLAERFLRRRDGSVSVIAPSRRSHAAADRLFARLFARELLAKPGRTIGEILQATRQALLATKGGPSTAPGSKLEWKRLLEDQVVLYNLLGDPAAVPPVPTSGPTIEAPQGARAGTRVKLSLSGLEADRPVHLGLDRPSGTLPQWAASEEGEGPSQVERYRAANEPRLAEAAGTCDAKGALQLELALPAWTPPGRYELRVWQDGSEGSRLAVRKFVVSAPDR